MIEFENDDTTSNVAEKARLTDWVNEPTVAELKQDYTEAESDKQIQIDKITNWLDNLNITGAAKPKKVAGRSTVAPKLIRKQAEWRYSSLSEPFLSTNDVFNVAPITFEDKKGAEQNQLVLNNQFNTKLNKTKLIDDIVRTSVNEGTTIAKVLWDFTQKRIPVDTPIYEMQQTNDPQYIQLLQQMMQGGEVDMAQFTPEEVEGIQLSFEKGVPVRPVQTGSKQVMETKTIRNNPTIEICDYRTVTIDPSAMGDMTKVNFIIHEFDTSKAELMEDGRYSNIDGIDFNSNAAYNASDSMLEEHSFDFKDTLRKRVTAYEYWGFKDISGEGILEAIVATYIGDVMIRLERNPFPEQELPFVVIPYLPVKNSLYGEPDGVLIEDNQKIIGAVTRGMIDIMAKSANGQIGSRKDALDVTNKRKFDAGKHYEYNSTVTSEEVFYMHTYPEIPRSASIMLELQNNEAESLTGVKAYASGISGQALGNMLDINTDIPLLAGSFKKLVDIVDGDVLIGSDGKATTVTKAHDVKEPEIAYSMQFDNGSTVISGGEHLWTIKVAGSKHSLREWHTVDADTVYLHLQQGKRVTIPKIQEVYTGTKVTSPIDPYVLGFWLGDGMSHSARITTEDVEVLTFFSTAGYDCEEVKDSSKTGNAKMYDVYRKGIRSTRDSKTGQYAPNKSFHSELKELNLLARYDGGGKHIPEMFFNATYEEKLELIRGLMDSDGFAHSKSFVQFAQSEGRLKDDFIRLIHSLGLKTSIRCKVMGEVNKRKLAHSERTGVRMIWARKDAYEIGFTPWSNPFKLSRKASKWQLPHKKTVTIKSMSVTDVVPMRCLTVDSEDKLFAVTKQFTLTHNTATGIRSSLDATSKRELAILRRITDGITQIGRKIIAMNAVFLDEEEIVRITNDEFVPIRRDDLAGKFDLTLTISTAEADEQKAQELAFMLQTMGQTLPFDMTQKLLAEIAKLRKMPAMAKQIEDYVPQPDPMEQKLKELEMGKLEAEVMNQQADAKLKMAKAEEALAKARNIGSDSDLKDLDFLDKDSGAEHNRELNLAGEQARANQGLAETKHTATMREKAFGALINTDKKEQEVNPDIRL